MLLYFSNLISSDILHLVTAVIQQKCVSLPRSVITNINLKYYSPCVWCLLSCLCYNLKAISCFFVGTET